MMNNGRFRKYLTDRNISLIIRWWAAGAVYFFIGWGTFLGSQQTLIDFVVILGLVMGVFNLLIVNPGLRMAFNINPKRPKQENTIWQRVSDNLLQFLMSFLIIFIVAWIYITINQTIIRLQGLPPDVVPLPGEPILFGLFYVIVFVILEWITEKIKDVISKVTNRKVK